METDTLTMTTCGACYEVAVPAPVFEDGDGKRINSVEERCTNCGQLWQYPNYPPAQILDRRFGAVEPKPLKPSALKREEMEGDQ